MEGSNSFELTTEDVGERVRIVAMRGEADRFRTDELTSAIEDARRAERDVIVDVSEVSYLDSSMLAAFVAASEHGVHRKDRLVVLCATPRLRRSLELKGLETILHLADSRDQALELAGA